MRLPVLLLLLILIAGCSDSQQAAIQKPVSAQAPESSQAVAEQPSPLVFEPDHVDMGTVKEGDEAVTFLRVRNSGATMQSIAGVQTSCGCSVAEPEERVIMPGGFTRIKVSIDTFAKMDDVKKWVSLTDGEGRTSKAWLTLNIRPNPHMGDTKRSIFDGKCAACHFDTAKGKTTGPEIYAAVCGMCHGGKGEGAAAPALTHHNDAGALALIIAEGTGSQHMPGFAQKHGGPLTEKQISALSEWLSKLDE